MCLPANEFMAGNADVRLGAIACASFCMSDLQFEYRQHTQPIIGCVPGNGGISSLERPTGLRFLTRSRLFADAEPAWLAGHPVEHTGT